MNITLFNRTFIQRSTLIIILWLLSTTCWSQKYLWYEPYDVDSLLKVLPGKDKKERVETLNKLSFSLLYSGDSVASRKYTREAINLSEELGFREGLAEAYLNLGYIHYYQGDFLHALQYYHQSLNLYQEANDRNKIARLYEEIARTHYYSNNVEKTLEYGYISLNVFKEKNNSGDMVGSAEDTLRVFASLAFVYAEHRELGMLERALQMYLAYYKTIQRTVYDTAAFLITSWYTGVLHHELGRNDSARFYINQALALPETNQNVINLKHKCLAWLGYIYHSEGKLDSSYAYFRKVIKYYSDNGFLFMASLNCNRLADLFLEANDLINAERYFMQSEALFLEMTERNSHYRYDSLKHVVSYGEELYLPLTRTQQKEMIWSIGRWLYGRLYHISLEQGRTADALHYLQAFGAAKDTMHVIDLRREAMELQTRYESERKDQQIASLAIENEWKESRLRLNRIFSISMTGFVFLIILMGTMLIRQNKLREEQNNIILQQRLFRTQMNPHFIFNSLSSIHHFMLNEDPVKAASYLARFSKLIRSILHGSVDEYTTLDKEIVNIENYLELQKIRFTEMFDYSFEIDENIDLESIIVPTMILQPFVENSIEHGIKHKTSKGNILIRCNQANNMIDIEVVDDGVGREKARELSEQQNKNHKSMATSIIRERIRVINKGLKKKILLEISDMMDDNGQPAGTRVLLEIPLI